MFKLALGVGEHGVELDSSKIAPAVSDFVDKLKAKIAPVSGRHWLTGTTFALDECDTFLVRRFDTKEVVYLKTMAAHWKGESELWRAAHSNLELIVEARSGTYEE